MIKCNQTGLEQVIKCEGGVSYKCRQWQIDGTQHGMLLEHSWKPESRCGPSHNV